AAAVGASGYLLKSDAEELLLVALQRLESGERFVSPAFDSDLANSLFPEKLVSSERSKRSPPSYTHQKNRPRPASHSVRDFLGEGTASALWDAAAYQPMLACVR